MFGPVRCPFSRFVSRQHESATHTRTAKQAQTAKPSKTDLITGSITSSFPTLQRERKIVDRRNAGGPGGPTQLNPPPLAVFERSFPSKPSHCGNAAQPRYSLGEPPTPQFTLYPAHADRFMLLGSRARTIIVYLPPHGTRHQGIPPPPFLPLYSLFPWSNSGPTLRH
ncbi:hypothetical protein BGY98DRAFT_1041359 [Russula aff. rugulosa BPL654]|nr:hypothetical protein BGY98DRAFT_1041359 [Russula aff. rugulosa BPL654]